MTIHITKDSLMDYISEVRDAFILEAEYTEEELRRLNAPSGEKAIASTNLTKSDERIRTFLPTQSDTEEDESEIKPVKESKHKVSTVIWITMGVALAAAAILLFVFLWNPDRSDVATTTESETSGETTDETMEEMKIDWSVEINDTNFPDSFFRRYISENFDIDKDGSLNEEECREVKEIDLNDASGNHTYSSLIESLKGIEFFPELEVLDSTQYTPTELSDMMREMDLTNNPELRKLTVGGKKLTSLDLSHNPKLETLEIQYVGFTSIDLSDNPNLKSLTIWSNSDFAYLNVDNNQLLEELCIESANLSTLDLYLNRRLKSLTLVASGVHPVKLSTNAQLEYLYISRVPIESLDLSGNPLLKQLNISGTSLKELDLRANTLLMEENIEESIKVIHADDNNSLTESVKDVRDAEIGDYISFGSYEQDSNIENGAEAIEWRVLDKQEDRMLVISRYGLDCKPYHVEDMDVTWETCSLRGWLNGDFYEEAFRPEEKRIILDTTVKTASIPEFELPPCNDTTDRVFLLSKDEVYQYFAGKRAGLCQGTPYSVVQGLYSLAGDSAWWLRSPGVYSDCAMYVDADGYVVGNGQYVNIDTFAVRPAMWIYTSQP